MYQGQCVRCSGTEARGRKSKGKLSWSILPCHVDVQCRDIVCHFTWRRKLYRWKWRVIWTHTNQGKKASRMASVNPQRTESLPRAASVLAENLHLDVDVVRTVITLLDKENTVPFIARYRKEQTGGLDPTVLRHIQAQYEQLKWVEILMWHSFFFSQE